MSLLRSAANFDAKHASSSVISSQRESIDVELLRTALLFGIAVSSLSQDQSDRILSPNINYRGLPKSCKVSSSQG